MITNPHALILINAGNLVVKVKNGTKYKWILQSCGLSY